MQLLERERELACVRAAIAQVEGGGPGTGFAITGDGGAGKSALVADVRELAGGWRFLRGHCDPLLAPRPLGPIRDVARTLGLPASGAQEALLSEVSESLFDALRSTPTALVVEDLHWVDVASVDVLRFLVRRVESAPLIVLLTYRDAEIDHRHPARALLGDIATVDGLTTLPLAALSPAAVAQLLQGTGLDPAAVHAATGGNPFFVTEVAKEPGRPVPTSVRDAVLARTSDILTEDFEILQLVASAPDRVDDRVLPSLGVDLPSLRRLDGTTLLNRTADGIVFRHELARQAIESTIPPGGAARLHSRLLEALERLAPQDPAVLTHHAVAARLAAKAATYARQAAAEAIRAGAHSEAAAFFEIALAHQDRADPAERAQLLCDLAFEQYMGGRLSAAIGNVSTAMGFWERAGDQVGAARAHASAAIYEYYDARRTQADRHLDVASAMARSSGASLVFGHARVTSAFLAYMRSAQVDDLLADADAVADAVPEDFLTLRRRMVRDVDTLAGGSVDARDRLLDDVDAARSQGFDELASTVYSQLAYLDVEQQRLRAAEAVLERSLPFTVERDIPICRQWQTGVRSRLHLAKGRWNAAMEDAHTVLDARDGMRVAALWPLLVSALVPLRRGEPAPREPLDRAWALADALQEPLRRLAVLSALAEFAWTTGDPDPRVTETALAELPTLTRPGTAWSAAGLACWLRRLGLPAGLPAQAPAPFLLSAAGRNEDAASWWRGVGDPFQEAMALADSSDRDQRSRAVGLLDRLGALGTADRLRLQLRTDGFTAVPQRPRERTRANPGGLTNRQLDVARLVARGHSNNEIAARLYISPKTADHHVSAVLAKLGVGTRREVIRSAEELGLY